MRILRIVTCVLSVPLWADFSLSLDSKQTAWVYQIGEKIRVRPCISTAPPSQDCEQASDRKASDISHRKFIARFEKALGIPASVPSEVIQKNARILETLRLAKERGEAVPDEARFLELLREQKELLKQVEKSAPYRFHLEKLARLFDPKKTETVDSSHPYFQPVSFALGAEPCSYQECEMRFACHAMGVPGFPVRTRAEAVNSAFLSASLLRASFTIDMGLSCSEKPFPKETGKPLHFCFEERTGDWLYGLFSESIEIAKMTAFDLAQGPQSRNPEIRCLSSAHPRFSFRNCRLSDDEKYSCTGIPKRGSKFRAVHTQAYKTVRECIESAKETCEGLGGVCAKVYINSSRNLVCDGERGRSEAVEQLSMGRHTEYFE